MANQSNRRRTVPTPIPTAISEPEVHRWPHPIPQPYIPAPGESTMHYIRCALSYQNELLSEIKTLLEQLTVDRVDGDETPEAK